VPSQGAPDQNYAPPLATGRRGYTDCFRPIQGIASRTFQSRHATGRLERRWNSRHLDFNAPDQCPIAICSDLPGWDILDAAESTRRHARADIDSDPHSPYSNTANVHNRSSGIRTLIVSASSTRSTCSGGLS